MLSRKLKKQGIRHNVLNAKQHDREAEIVAQAGRKSAVTISTNMAGRGTDIVLGGNAEMLALAKCGGDKEHEDYPETLAHYEAECARERDAVLEAGGLHIMGTERHESRRIDNQLRGRAGRQGDPGSSQFFLSLEDDLLRIFEADRVKQWWDRVGVEEGEAIENKLLTRVIENAQKKVEARNFDIRKHLLEYDNVMNNQRQAFYSRRREALEREDVHDEILDMVEGAVVESLDAWWPEKGEPDAEALGELAKALAAHFGVEFDATAPPFSEGGKPASDRDAFGRAVLDRLTAVLEEKKKACDALAEQYASEDPAPDPRRAVEGPPAHHGRAARGHRPARLRLARPQARVPTRGLRAVRGDERPDRHAGDRAGVQVRAAPAAGRDRAPLVAAGGAGGRRSGTARPAVARRAARRGRQAGSCGEGRQGGQGRPQRPLSLRQRQEVQEVPRRGLRPGPRRWRSRLRKGRASRAVRAGGKSIGGAAPHG
jgi:hypothetical protein